MRETISAIMIALMFFPLCLSIPSTSFAEQGDKMAEKKQQYMVRLLGTRDGWPENMSAEEQKIMEEHYQYLKDLTIKKKVIMAGPVFDPVFGLIVFNTMPRNELQAIMDKEPSVAGGVHTYEISPMRVSLLVNYISPFRYAENQTEAALRKEIIVPATIDEVWETWTTTEGVKTFFSHTAKVDLRIGGPFEIYFLREGEQRGSEDCKILSYLPKKMLSFEWNGTPAHGELRFIKTIVVLEFEELSDDEVRVTLTHHGWGDGENWTEVYDYFDKAWAYVLGNLKKRFEDGPLKWQ